MQWILNNFSRASKAFGLTISIKKTELVHQSIRDHPSTVAPNVYVDGKALKTVSLLHLSWFHCVIEQPRRIVEVNVYKTVVLTTLLYGAESWTLYRKHFNQLDAFHMQCLRIISKTDELLTKCDISGIEAILIKIQLRWPGHLSRVSDIRITKQLLFDQFPTRKSIGRPVLRFKDKLKDNLKRCNILFSSWENKASECKIWYQSCFSSDQKFEQNRLQYRDQLHESMEANWQNTAPYLSLWFCGMMQSRPCHPLKKTHSNRSTSTQAN
uniref:Reverse transcriptase domain-containing protein n=1 Tax=Octopus bimaculoides TaxID=37653 RepID=A0A0L8G1T4_OCTBM